MLIEEAMCEILNADSGVQSSFGASPVRIYADNLPDPDDTSYPAATYRRVSDVPFHGIWQDAAHDAARVRIQVTVYAETRAECRAAASAVKTAFSRYHGPVGDVRIDDSILDAERDIYEDAPMMAGLIRIDLDFLVVYQGA